MLEANVAPAAISKQSSEQELGVEPDPLLSESARRGQISGSCLGSALDPALTCFPVPLATPVEPVHQQPPQLLVAQDQQLDSTCTITSWPSTESTSEPSPATRRAI